MKRYEIPNRQKCFVALDHDHEMVLIDVDRSDLERRMRCSGHSYQIVEALVSYYRPKSQEQLLAEKRKETEAAARRQKELERKIIQAEPAEGCITANEYIQRMCNGVSYAGTWSVEWLSTDSQAAILKKSPGTVWSGIGCPPKYVPTERILVDLARRDDYGIGLYYTALKRCEGKISPIALRVWKQHAKSLRK